MDQLTNRAWWIKIRVHHIQKSLTPRDLNVFLNLILSKANEFVDQQCKIIYIFYSRDILVFGIPIFRVNIVIRIIRGRIESSKIFLKNSKWYLLARTRVNWPSNHLLIIDLLFKDKDIESNHIKRPFFLLSKFLFESSFFHHMSYQAGSVLLKVFFSY